MNSSHKNTIYLVVNYSFNENIFELITSIEKLCFSFISVSLQNNFKIYIIYNNFYSLLFPSKSKDPTYILTSNFAGIHESIEEALNNFLSTVPELDEELYQSEQKKEKIEKSFPINVILKKILLEVNKKKVSNTSQSPGGFFLGMGIGVQIKDKIILINDSEEDFGNINQKYIFLLKEKNVKIDILSLNQKNKNEISKAICLFTKGIFDCINDKKNIVEQMLIFENIPIKFCETMTKLNNDIKCTISYNKAISNKNLECACCHKEIKIKKNIYIENKDDMDIDDDFNNKNEIKENNTLYYFEKEKNIFCKNCSYKIKNNK